MKKRDLKSWIVRLGAIFLSWLGLAGFSDNLVEWRDWFDVGVMEHWRAVKFWLTETFLFWIPFNVPSWVIDYCVLGCVFMRPYILHTTKRSGESADELMRKQRLEQVKRGEKVTPYVVQHQSGIPVLWVFASLLFWPVVLIGEIRDYISNSIRGIESPQSITIFKITIISIVSFIPILFVATDLIETFASEAR
ncbi:hypothetical protein [Sulfitobacter sp. M23508]|uniref:hypothetical protein n=1 Tax=Sulfitobacter sp. M23508 TaxID=3368577 RepID=UPI00374666BD